MSGVSSCLESADPLTRETAKFLVEYNEEDDRVDYKETADLSMEKTWLELTKDISAFANTYGGYLVFGVSDSNRQIASLNKNVIDTIKDVNNIHQKINRYLEPNISNLRSKPFKISGASIIILCIPQSRGITHLISKDAGFKHPSGKEKILLRKGTFYVRRSGGNHLGDSRDFDGVLERRIDQFRDALLEKVAKVVKSPASSDVFILSKDSNDTDAKRYIIEDSPDSIAVKGMSFTVAPEGYEEEIAAWSVLSRGNSESIPSPVVTWRWYADRKSIKISESHCLKVFQFCLWNNVPACYWIRNSKSRNIREVLFETIRNRPNNDGIQEMLIIACFLGRSTYKKGMELIGDYRKRLGPDTKKFPNNGPIARFATLKPGKKMKLATFDREQESLIDSIAEIVKKTGKPPALPKRWNALKIDKYLYVRNDQYK